MKLKTHIVVGLLSLAVFPGCNYLDKMPDDQKTMDMVWSTIVMSKMEKLIPLRKR